MKLQLALDDLDLVKALRMIELVHDSIDIIEVGTPFVIDEGMRAVREIKRFFPEKEVLADLKIMDAGYYEAELAFEAGAEYATVLGVTDVLTVKGCVEVAEKYNRKIVVDMICVEDMPGRIAQMEATGAHILAVHTGADQQAAGREPIDDLRVMAQHVKSAQMSVAGGISSRTAQKYVDLKPAILIVGTGITHQKDPRAEAAAIKQIMMGAK
ncbi:3-hexulose-6-phosphate synthase [Salmonella enterica]|uniref:3-dehydro-L-gulonate-6-phosphate decarboxylase n=1 Tax=Salmonella enterica TaxID=28901 RepID=A0A3K8YCY3_SALER|nr:3-hexulose-6-phosphate synthase [Citrobacter freundii]EAM5558125.1 3-hexulose-6-phosphate synthase [Salmonella enterica]MDF6517998.1 3-hexulose-6-phosphate synthase [Escherichia coli]EAO9613458.1 3-hexulose-6-phosphate synthase [Salmonella enterica]EAP1482666.1 3-hexulose-6-phosphate synthase [Salmonella enterica]EAU5157670.1 3-hexulose-6-phosphate synthase [Salmonella enterica]